MDEYFLVYTTTSTKSEARAMAGSLVKSRLAACVTYFPTDSTYVWDGKLERSREYILLCKTTKKRLAEVESKIKLEHSYECPEVISVKIHGGSRRYLDWVRDSTG